MRAKDFIVNFKGSDEVFDSGLVILSFKIENSNVVMNVSCGLIFLILKQI